MQIKLYNVFPTFANEYKDTLFDYKYRCKLIQYVQTLLVSQIMYLYKIHSFVVVYSIPFYFPNSHKKHTQYFSTFKTLQKYF